jgi:nitric oxide reductase subunit C
MVKVIKTTFLLFCLYFIICGELSTEATDYPLPDQPEKGIEIFKEKNCVSCHSIWGVGGNIGPDLSRAVKDKSFYQIVGLLWNHSSKMFEKMKEEEIAFNKMSAEEVEYLTAYLYYLNFFDSPGDFERGKILYLQRKCVICHSIGGGKKGVGPRLDRYGWMISPVYLGTSMWNHRSKMKDYFMEKNISIPEFGEQDITDILTYIRGISIGETEDRKYLQPGNPNSGKEIFIRKKCNTCHAIFGKGTGYGPDLGEEKLSKSITALTAVLWNHLDKMEAMYNDLGLTLPEFKPQEMADLLTYLYYISFFEKGGNVVNGKKVFNEKGCAQCHGVSGKGESAAPDLSLSDVEFGSFEFASRIWNHTEKMGEIFSSELIAWPIFRDDEMRDLISYLQSMSGKKE